MTEYEKMIKDPEFRNTMEIEDLFVEITESLLESVLILSQAIGMIDD